MYGTEAVTMTKPRNILLFLIAAAYLGLTHGCATPQPAATRSIQLELPAMEYAK